MFVLIVLFGSLLLFRFIGFFGMPIFASWHAANDLRASLDVSFHCVSAFRQIEGRPRTDGSAMGAEPARRCFDNRFPRDPAGIASEDL
jgi:hypothetical protein